MAALQSDVFSAIVNKVYDIFEAVRSYAYQLDDDPIYQGLNQDLAGLGSMWLGEGKNETFYEDVSDTGDPDVTLTMLTAAYNVDEFLKVGFDPDIVLKASAELKALITALESHLRRAGAEAVFTSPYLENYLRHIDADNTGNLLTMVDDIWGTLRGHRLQARAVPCPTARTLYTLTTGGWARGQKLFTDFSNTYSPSMQAGKGAGAAYGDFENFRDAPLSVVKTSAGTLTGTLTVTGLNGSGQSVTVGYGSISLVDTDVLMLDDAYGFVSVTSATFGTAIPGGVSIYIKNQVPAEYS